MRLLSKKSYFTRVASSRPLPVKKGFGNTRRRFRIPSQKYNSLHYAQSATTTTAASGGNREELLGQRPARRKCRPRHDADAGCRNPISGGHSKSSSRSKGRCNVAASFLSHLPHFVLDSKHFCERLPRRIDKAVWSCYVSIDKSVFYGALCTLFHHAAAAAERIKT